MKFFAVATALAGAVLIWFAINGQTPDFSKGPLGLLQQIYADLAKFFNHSHSVTTPPDTPGGRGQTGFGPGAGAGSGGSGGGGGSW